jgi:hypothetical protein
VQAKAELIDKIYAIANEAVVTRIEVIQRAERIKAAYVTNSKQVPSEAELLKEAADEIIIERLEHQILLSVNDKRIEDMLADPIKYESQAAGLSQQQFVEKYKPDHLSVSDFALKIRNSFIKNQIHGSIIKYDREPSDAVINEIIQQDKLLNRAAIFSFTEYLFIPLKEDEESLRNTILQAQEFNKRIKQGELPEDVLTELARKDLYEVTTKKVNDSPMEALKPEYIKGFLNFSETDKTIYNELKKGISVIWIRNKKAKVFLDNKYDLYVIKLNNSSKEAINKINNIKKSIKNLDDFKKAAILNSHDTKTAKNGGKLEPIFNKNMPEYLQKEMLIYDAGEITDIIYNDRKGVELYWVENIKQDDLFVKYVRDLAINIYNQKQNEADIRNNRGIIIKSSVVKFFDDEDKS